MWNTLGGAVFGDPSQEEIRPWYYTWSLMCRCFPAGSRIVKLEGKMPEGVAGTAAVLPDGSVSVALVNFGGRDYPVNLNLPVSVRGYTLSCFRTRLEERTVSGSSFVLPAQSVAVLAR